MNAYLQPALSYVSNMDSSILYWVQSLGPAWKGVAWVLSYGVSYEAMIVVFALALFLMRKHRIALELLAIAVLSLGATYVLKYLFHAPRPYAIDPAVIFFDKDGGYGLPSAHALMSVVILGWIAIRHPRSHIIAWGSVALILLIGLSRVYLGVHYPSQVLAGWILGILFLYIFRVIDKRLWSPFKKTLRK